jgi:hypothetical protein
MELKDVKDFVWEHRPFMALYETSQPGVYQLEDYGTAKSIVSALERAGCRDVSGVDDSMDGEPYALVQFKMPTDAGRALVASQDAKSSVTAFPVSDDGTVSVSAKAYHDLERRIADLEAQAIKDARTIEGLSAQIVHAQMELAAALGHDEVDYHANLPDLADEVSQIRRRLTRRDEGG